jgi:WD40 repeat protein
MVNNYKNVILLNDSFKEDSNYAFDMKITALLYYYSKNFLFIGFDNGKLYYLNLESQNLHEIGKHDKIINRIIPINEKYIASGSEDKKIIIWDFANCKPYSEINAHHKGVIALEYIKGELKENKQYLVDVNNNNIVIKPSTEE